jgi:hypothetical protein
MIAPADWNTPMNIARNQTRTDRFNAAVRGMRGCIADYFAESPRWWANRSADGLTPIDNAAHAVDNGWVGWGGAGAASDAAVTTLLQACNHWLTTRNLCGIRITGWREAHIHKLYWQTAWCYSCDNYAAQAMLTVAANNAGGNATVTQDPVAAAAAVGNPYDFNLCGYVHQPLAPARVLRGDSRDPAAILLANGFQPVNLASRWLYKPWFDGNALDDTKSVTTVAALAIEAGPAAHRIGYPIGAGPAWLAAEQLRLNVGPPRGYVYEFNAGALQSTRLLGTPLGTEHIFLALPAGSIINWWFVQPDRSTVGPYPFPDPGHAPGVPAVPLGPAMPGVAATVSAAVRTLA